MLKQRVKVLITKDGDEKEIREYHVEELTFDKKKHSSDNLSNPIGDEEIDEKALLELQKMEQHDIEDMAEEQQNQMPKKQGKKPFNKQNFNKPAKNPNHNSYNKANKQPYKNSSSEIKKHNKKPVSHKNTNHNHNNNE